MVHLESLLVKVNGQLTRTHDPAGIVRQDIDPGIFLLQLRGKRAHLGQVSEVADEIVSADLFGHRLGLFS